MNTSRNVIHRAFKILRRNLSTLNIEQLLSEENKVKTLESFKKLTKVKYGEKIKRHAAILIPICVSNNNQLSILYTLRSTKLRTHKGQISFPGKKESFINSKKKLNCYERTDSLYIHISIFFSFV